MLSSPSDKDVIAEWANAILAKHGLKPKQAADRTGLPPSTVHRLLGRDPKYLFTPSFRIVSQFAQGFSEAMPEIHLAGEEGLGFTEPQVEAITGSPPPEAPELAAGQSLWRVRGDELIAAGYLPGDFMVLDQSGIAPRDGDHVLINIHDDRLDDAVTELRIFQKDWLLPAAPAAAAMLYVRDGSVTIMGIIVRRWWERR